MLPGSTLMTSTPEQPVNEQLNSVTPAGVVKQRVEAPAIPAAMTEIAEGQERESPGHAKQAKDFNSFEIFPGEHKKTRSFDLAFVLPR